MEGDWVFLLIVFVMVVLAVLTAMFIEQNVNVQVDATNP